MKPQTRQNINLFSVLIAFPILGLVSLYFLLINEKDVPQNPQEGVEIEQNLSQTHLEQLQEQFSVPELTCKQLFGDEKRYQDPRPQVECEADKPGFFFWQDQDERGNWAVFYYNQYPMRIAGFMFTTNPEEIKITFKDMNGNEAEVIIEIVSNFRPCTLENNCSRVEHVV